MDKITFWKYITTENPITVPCAFFILALAVLALVFNQGYTASFAVGYSFLALEVFFWAMVWRAYRRL